MLYSKRCQYAIRALAHLAAFPKGKRCLARDIARDEGIPAPYLAKIVQDLARSGLVLSFKGPSGGFTLAHPPDAISLYDVITSVDGPTGFRECSVGLAECSDSMPCPLHPMWKPLRTHLEEYFQQVSLADMARAVREKKRLLRRSASRRKRSS